MRIIHIVGPRSTIHSRWSTVRTRTPEVDLMSLSRLPARGRVQAMARVLPQDTGEEGRYRLEPQPDRPPRSTARRRLPRSAVGRCCSGLPSWPLSGARTTRGGAFGRAVDGGPSCERRIDHLPSAGRSQGQRARPLVAVAAALSACGTLVERTLAVVAAGRLWASVCLVGRALREALAGPTAASRRWCPGRGGGA